MSEERPPDARPENVDETCLAEWRREFDAHVERARQHHARTGEWPPDPLLDEVDEWRREILAEHGNDYRKVWEWYVELDRQAAEQEVSSRTPEKQERPAA
jgi:hypothetical protein